MVIGVKMQNNVIYLPKEVARGGNFIERLQYHIGQKRIFLPGEERNCEVHHSSSAEASDTQYDRLDHILRIMPAHVSKDGSRLFLPEETFMTCIVSIERRDKRPIYGNSARMRELILAQMGKFCMKMESAGFRPEFYSAGKYLAFNGNTVSTEFAGQLSVLNLEEALREMIAKNVLHSEYIYIGRNGLMEAH